MESTDEFDSDWVKTNEDQVRASPLVVGGVSVALLLLNRLLSGVAPVADASSAQSRADVLCLGMAGVNGVAMARGETKTAHESYFRWSCVTREGLGRYDFAFQQNKGTHVGVGSAAYGDSLW